MLPFEAYFGFLIKFVNPACFCFFLFTSLAADIRVPFGLVPELTTYGTLYVYVAVLIIFAPMLMCAYPEEFKHNVEKEFSADDVFETKARIRQRMAKELGRMVVKAKENAIEMPDIKVTPKDKEGGQERNTSKVAPAVVDADETVPHDTSGA